MNLARVIHAGVRAIGSQLHVRMLLLSLLPFFASLFLWGTGMWWGLQSLMDLLQTYFLTHDLFKAVGDSLQLIGLLTIKTLIVPLLAMWLLLPILVITSLLMIGVFAMPVMNRHLSQRQYAQLEQRNGGNLLGSMAYATGSFLLFAMLWLASLPLLVFPLAHLLIQPFLWGWLSYRVMTYDALAVHADEEERKALVREHRLPLLFIGVVTGILGSLPTMLWLGGVFSFVLFPLIASLAIWLYVLIFIFSGLWFQHYCLMCLSQMREQRRNHEYTIQPEESAVLTVSANG